MRQSQIFRRIIEKLIIIFIISMVCFSHRIEIPSQILDIPTSTPIAPTKQVSSINLPLVEKWRWSGIIHNLFGPPLIVISDKKLIIAMETALGKEKIVVFDARTGQVIWKSRAISNLRSIDSDDKRVYMGDIRYVRAYDLETGQIEWEGAKQDDFKRGGLYVYLSGSRLNVYDPYDNYLYLLDPGTGQILERTRYPNIYFQKDGFYYLCSKEVVCLTAVNKTSGERVWANAFGDDIIYKWPIFVDNRMFINADGKLVALAVKTGEIVWQSAETNFVTAMTLGDDTVYAIRGDAAIVGFNPDSGQQVGFIEIEPEQDLIFRGGQVPYYAIAASDKFVAAYYSNSNELIVFEKVNYK